MSIQLGDEAPDFSAESTDGAISFHDFLGTDQHLRVAAAVLGQMTVPLGERARSAYSRAQPLPSLEQMDGGGEEGR